MTHRRLAILLFLAALTPMPAQAQNTQWVRGVQISVKGDGLDDARAKAITEAARLAAQRSNLTGKWAITSSKIDGEHWDGIRYSAAVDVLLAHAAPPRERIEQAPLPEIRTEREPPVRAGDVNVPPLGHVEWILVVNAVRGPQGDLALWDGDWAVTWRVPGNAGGTRYVPVSGDSEDRSHVKATGGRQVDGLGFLASKYRAPAVALIVRETNGVSVAGWHGGSTSGWSRATVPASADGDAAKNAALGLLAHIFPSHDADPQIATADADQAAGARIVAWRQSDPVTVQYQVMVQGAGEPAPLRRLIEGVNGLRVSKLTSTPEGYEVLIDDTSASPEPIERRLTQAGLPAAADGR